MSQIIFGKFPPWGKLKPAASAGSCLIIKHIF